ncbi:MAG: ribbon-helix-helix protein, CopG family [Terracidiphilus sp.]|jgi:CopG family transcriptional regulator/antitoxin EndoAI
MRTTKVVSITLPPPLFEEAKALAKQENRTMSELMREALRRYQRERDWERIETYGRAAAERAGVRTEEDVVNIIHEFRKEQEFNGDATQSVA